MDKDLQIELLKKDVSFKDKELDKVEKIFTSRGFTNIEQMATMFDYYKLARDKTIDYIENDMPYLQEPDEEFERCDGTTYMTMKEYDTSILLNKLKGEENENN